jgi:hypothetical protein
VPTQIALTKYLFHLLQILLEQSDFENVVSVFDFSNLQLSSSCEVIDLIVHEERHVDRLFNAHESA